MFPTQGSFSRTAAALISSWLLCLHTVPVDAFSATPVEKPTAAAATSPPGSSGRQSPQSLLRNWWPVSLEGSLRTDRPNGIELLNKKLVLFHDGELWRCLDDRCSHRFAPLSEGRVIDDDCNAGGKCLQCAYHGWEFNGKGTCQSIPQSSETETSVPSSLASVRTYPVRTGGQMIWVWSDPDPSTFPEATAKTLPISPLFEAYLEEFPGIGFQRDLPYGMELLGENLLDVSHLPFSHHSVGGLNRNLARPLRLRMLSSEERMESALSEREGLDRTTGTNGDGDGDGDEDGYHVATFQAEMVNASLSDPTLLANVARGMAVNAGATSSSGFYAPCHVRYRRTVAGGNSHVELFFCPTTPGRSRVFLFNVLERIMKRKLDESVTKRKGWVDRWKQRYVNSRIRVLVGGSNWRGHMMAHAIFDGDGIFLNKQGDRMNRDGLSHVDYFTPTSADLLVNNYRRWLDAAADATLADGTEEGRAAAEAAVGRVRGRDGAAVAASGGGPYLDRDERAAMLDRYESHTKSCETCLNALAQFERKKSRLDVISVAMMGALGASGSVLSMAAFLVLFGGNPSFVAKASARAAAAVAVGAGLGAFGAGRARQKVEKVIEKFYFVDYVHSEKD